MATVFILAGSMVGFATALASLLVAGSSILMGLAIWTAVGMTAVGLALVVGMAKSQDSAAAERVSGQQRSA